MLSVQQDETSILSLMADTVLPDSPPWEERASRADEDWVFHQRSMPSATPLPGNWPAKHDAKVRHELEASLLTGMLLYEAAGTGLPLHQRDQGVHTYHM